MCPQIFEIWPLNRGFGQIYKKITWLEKWKVIASRISNGKLLILMAE